MVHVYVLYIMHTYVIIHAHVWKYKYTLHYIIIYYIMLCYVIVYETTL